MVYRHLLQLAFAAGLCLLVAGIPARADLVTDAASIPVPQKVVDFSQFSGGYNFFGPDFHSNPVQIGRSIGENILWSSTDATSFLGDDGGNPFLAYDLSPNGFWDDGRVGFSALDVVSGTMTYTFSNPVSAVGGFINYAPDPTTSVTIAALDSNGNVLESYDITNLAPISTPGQMDAGAFRGIVLPNAIIASFQVSDSYVALDNLTFSRAPAVPEPSALVLFAASGLSGVVLLQRRKPDAKTFRHCRRGA